MNIVLTRRLAACVLLVLLVGSVFDRCLVACTYAAADTPAVPACHHDDQATSAAATPDGAFSRACDLDHRVDANPAELRLAGGAQELARALLAEVPPFALHVVVVSSARTAALNGPPLLVLDSGSDRRQLRL